MAERKHLTRHQREHQGVVARHRRKQKIIMGGLTGLLASAVIVGYASINAQPTNGDIQPTPTVETQPYTTSQFIQGMAKEWGVRFDPTEQTLWQSGDEKSTKSFTPEEATQEALRRLRTARILMEQSQNEYFQAAAGIYARKDVVITTYTPETLEKIRPGATSYARPRDDEIIYRTSLDEYAVTQLSSFGLAVVLTHEAKHIMSYMTHQQSLDPSLPTWEKFLRYYDEFGENLANTIEEELQSYSIQATAYIVGVGMTGYQGERDSSLEQVAAIYLRTGGPNGPIWRQFIEGQVMSSFQKTS